MEQPVRKKVIVFGADGMLGHRIFREFREADDIDVQGTIRKDYVQLLTFHSLYEKSDLIIDNIDATDIDVVQGIIEDRKPDFVVNCIGIIKQREEEAGSKLLMTKVNQLLPHAMNESVRKYGGKLITFSSDCVFLGDKSRAYSEHDEPDAYSIYGRTKALGEATDGNALTLRTSFIGFEVKGFTSLLEWFFRAVSTYHSEEKPIRGFTQAMWSGVTTQYMAELVLEIIRDHQNLSGLFQIASDPMTKFELLQKLNESFSLGVEIERDSIYIPDKICNRWLSCNVFPVTTGITIPSWDDLMLDLVEDYNFYKAHRE